MEDIIYELENFEKKISIDTLFLNIQDVHPHERVMENRLDGLLLYMNSLLPYYQSFLKVKLLRISMRSPDFHALRPPIYLLNYLKYGE